MATFRHEGRHIDYTPGSAVAPGDVLVLGELVCVADVAIEANRKGAVACEGVYEFDKATGGSTAIAVGTKVYYDAAEGEVGADDESGANKLAGTTVEAAGDSDAKVLVKLAGASV